MIAEVPPFTVIFSQAARGSLTKEGEIELTVEEMPDLMEDPVFMKYYPEMAAEIRNVLEKLNSS